MDSTKTIALNIVQAKPYQALTTSPLLNLFLIEHMNHFLSIFKHSSLLEFQSITNLNTTFNDKPFHGFFRHRSCPTLTI